MVLADILLEENTMCSEMIKNRIAALLLIPFLIYVDNQTLHSGGIALAIMAFCFFTILTNLFPSLYTKRHTVWSESGFFVTMFGVLLLFAGEFRIAILLVCVGVIGIIAIKYTLILWTAKP
jgi:hypothetical protein